MIREIIHIDEEKCDGCGLCVPACHEGAIRIIDGKARLTSEAACDGMGACLGHCPQGAITIERREADAFDEAAVAATEAESRASSRPATPARTGLPVQAGPAVPQATPHAAHTGGHGGCPGSRMMQFRRPAAGAAAGAATKSGTNGACAGETAQETPSELMHWPVQLRLLPPHAPVLNGASLLLAADCVPVALADFHRRLLRGRAVLISCPKFDDPSESAQRLAAILAQAGVREVVVARMEVPCCGGIVAAAQVAREMAGVEIPIREVIIGVDGAVRAEREVPRITAA